MNDNLLNNDAQDDMIIFKPEEENLLPVFTECWKIVIVDDDPEVHEVTRMVLEHAPFSGRGFELLSCYTGTEAKAVLADNPDTAVVLLDVVMETDDAGLKLVQWIRNGLRNSLIRILLRTGQPGQAPESKIVLEYNINGYLEKADLTAQKLFTAIISAVRSYRDVVALEDNRRGLQKIIETSSAVFELQSMQRFAVTLFSQLAELMSYDESTLPLSGFIACSDRRRWIRTPPSSAEEFITTFSTECKQVEKIVVLAGVGKKFDAALGCSVKEVVSEADWAFVQDAWHRRKNVQSAHCFIRYLPCKLGMSILIYIDDRSSKAHCDKELLDIFFHNANIAFDNIYMNEMIENTQREAINMLGDFAEVRSMETGRHVVRVAKYCRLLAMKLGLADEEIKMLELASPLHDIGKISTPDHILNKPGPLTPDEYEIMKQHVSAGYNILKNSQQPIMQTAALIVMLHHERFDGFGYPRGLRGDDIHIFGRIAAVGDVFDALGNDRVYRPAWSAAEIEAFFCKERGKHFDPDLVDILLENFDEFIAIY